MANKKEEGLVCLEPGVFLNLEEPTCIELAIGNALQRAHFLFFGPHGTAHLVREAMDEYLKSIDGPGQPPASDPALK